MRLLACLIFARKIESCRPALLRALGARPRRRGLRGFRCGSRPLGRRVRSKWRGGSPGTPADVNVSPELYFAPPGSKTARSGMIWGEEPAAS